MGITGRVGRERGVGRNVYLNKNNFKKEILEIIRKESGGEGLEK